jgi:hemerythrin superfamily protein
MESRENQAEEIEMSEESVNRTGIMNRPDESAALLRGVEELIPSSDGDSTELAEMRAEYLQEAAPLGCEPLPVDDSAAQAAEVTDAFTVLLDKLGERLAFERQGTRLYEAFLQRFELLGLEQDNQVSAAELRHICDEEFDHFRNLQQTIVRLGGDATVMTPSADVAGVLSKGVVEIIADPRTTFAQCLLALLTAELADNDGWQMLGELAAQLGLDELENQCRTALEAEEEHLEKVRHWLLDATLQKAQAASPFADKMALDEAADASQGERHQKNAAAEERDRPDGLELLKQDHQKVKALFEEAESAEDDKEKRKIFKQLKKELEIHTRVEESVFYPAMQEYDELKDMVLESIEEHKQVKKLLREMDRLGKTSDKFEPKLKVLQENVEHHAEEEEEGKMFPKIRELLDSAELQQLGRDLEAAKRQRQRKAS